jgi:hypothetical protein
MMKFNLFSKPWWIRLILSSYSLESNRRKNISSFVGEDSVENLCGNCYSSTSPKS